MDSANVALPGTWLLTNLLLCVDNNCQWKVRLQYIKCTKHCHVEITHSCCLFSLLKRSIGHDRCIAVF